MSLDPRPCLSVIVPCFNEEATIEDLLGQVLASPWVAEVIVVDDGSRDRSREILASFQNPRVRVVLHEQNRGKGRVAHRVRPCDRRVRHRPGCRP